MLLDEMVLRDGRARPAQLDHAVSMEHLGEPAQRVQSGLQASQVRVVLLDRLVLLVQVVEKEGLARPELLV